MFSSQFIIYINPNITNHNLPQGALQSVHHTTPSVTNKVLGSESTETDECHIGFGLFMGIVDSKESEE